MGGDDEEEVLRQRQQRKDKKRREEMDSILDAALDDLNDDDSDDSDDDDEDASDNEFERAAEADGGECDGEEVTQTQALPLQNHHREVASNSSSSLSPPSTSESVVSKSAKKAVPRPKFGPEPPPSMRRNRDNISGSGHGNDGSGGAGEGTTEEGGFGSSEDDMMASLDGMMREMLRVGGGSDDGGIPNLNLGTGGDGGNAGLDNLAHSEKVLEDLFQKMVQSDITAANTASNPASSGSASKSSKKSKSKKGTPTSSSGNDSKTKTTARADNASDNNDDAKADVDESISRLLDGISTGAAEPAPPGDMDPSAFEKMGEEMMGSVMSQFEKMSASKDADNAVDGVMKRLLDKDLMYEPMRQVTQKFPKWLAENKDDLSEEDYKRYGTQYQYFQRIVRLYETEPDNFPRLMELMQDIQEFGQPPVEIISELAPDLEFDEEGMPIMTGDASGMGLGMGGMPPIPGMNGAPGSDQCSVM